MPDGTIAFTGSAEKTFARFSVEIYFQAFKSDVLFLLLLSRHRYSFRDHQTGKDATTFANIPSQGISTIKVRPDNKLVAVSGWDSAIRIFGTTKKMKPLVMLRGHKQGVQCLCFVARDMEKISERFFNYDWMRVEAKVPENLFAVGSKDGTVSLWQVY